MKKIIIVLGLAIMAIANLQAQNSSDTLNIYRKNIGILKIALVDIDSLTISTKTVLGIVLTTTSQFTVTDIDGNAYNVVTIGGQVWLKENLKVTKLNDGSVIPLVTSTVQWAALTTPGYCFYNNSTINGVTYGALYNWYTVNTGKLCPTGWHVPSDVEWTTLTTVLGGVGIAGGKLKATGTAYWNSPNTGATNETGFTALPGGSRFSDISFYNIGKFGLWWSSTESYPFWAFSRSMDYSNNFLDYYYYTRQSGFSVRCLKD